VIAKPASAGRGRSTHLALSRHMSDIRFQSIEDGDLADIWYALGGAAARHPDHFQKLMDECFQELLERREASLKPWLEERYRPFRLTDSREDAASNLQISQEAAP
jgi:hypothetical protein